MDQIFSSCFFLLLLLTFKFCAPDHNYNGNNNNNNYGVARGTFRGAVTTPPLVLSGDDYNNNGDRLTERNRRPTNSQPKTSADPIVFPNWGNSSEESYHPDRETTRVLPKPAGKIPLKFLRELSNEYNVAAVFEKYVQNVKLKDVKGQTYLVNLNGQPVDSSVGDPVVIATTTHSPPTFSVFGSSSFGKPVAQLPERTPPSSPMSNADPKLTVNNYKPSMITNTRINTFGGRPVTSTTTTERIAQGGIESGLERITKPAICEPELKTVQVPGPSDPSVIHFPSCVRIPQCGGCCISNLLSCEPTDTKEVEVQIQKLLYKTESELEYVGTEKITMQAHTQCNCGCRIKPSSCSANHYHDPDQCQCICKNQGESQACHALELKLWNPSSCKCECREAKECNSGFTFSPETCTCKPESRRPTADSRNRNRRDRHYPGRQAENLQIGSSSRQG